LICQYYSLQLQASRIAAEFRQTLYDPSQGGYYPFGPTTYAMAARLWGHPSHAAALLSIQQQGISGAFLHSTTRKVSHGQLVNQFVSKYCSVLTRCEFPTLLSFLTRSNFANHCSTFRQHPHRSEHKSEDGVLPPIPGLQAPGWPPLVCVPRYWR